ncbi:drug/metabolite exporter YedA [Ravibacter arvi]|uniref:Drug/metabolite exporter YedA n=1 Tax=Ravibacter arvi TaxID=2051041 RepID=A0ABP8MAF6_9BACT
MMHFSTSGGLSQQSKLVLNLLSVYFIWGSTYLFIHFMTESMPPLYMAGWRLLVAGGILYPVARLSGHARPNGRESMSAGLLGILLLGCSMGGMTIAIQYLPTGIAALLAGLLPLFLIVMNWVTFARKKPSVLAMTGLLVGIAGIVMLVQPGSFKETSSESWIGIVLIFFADVFWAAGTLLSARLKLPGQMVSSAVQMLVGGVVLLSVSLLFEPVTMWSIFEAPDKALGSLLYLVVFGSIIGFSSYSWLARNAPPQLLSTYAYVNPVVAMFLGWAFAGEVLSGQSLMAGIVILIGVICIVIGRK